MLLKCDVCNEERWGADGAPCILTRDCKGRLRKVKRAASFVVEGQIGDVVWTQQALFEEERPKVKDPT